MEAAVTASMWLLQVRPPSSLVTLTLYVGGCVQGDDWRWDDISDDILSCPLLKAADGVLEGRVIVDADVCVCVCVCVMILRPRILAVRCPQ